MKFLCEALKDETPKLSIKEMQAMFEASDVDIEPGPDSMTIGIIYRVGELMMQDSQFKLARDCYSIVYDITQEKGLIDLLDQLDSLIE